MCDFTLNTYAMAKATYFGVMKSIKMKSNDVSLNIETMAAYL